MTKLKVVKDEQDNAEAVARVREAMALVEEAQRNLELACQRLSPIIGGAGQWRKVGALYDRVRAQWYTLDGWLRTNGHKLKLDGVGRR